MKLFAEDVQGNVIEISSKEELWYYLFNLEYAVFIVVKINGYSKTIDMFWLTIVLTNFVLIVMILTHLIIKYVDIYRCTNIG